MKKIKYIVFILALAFTSCEENDIPNPDKSSISTDFGYENQFDKFLRREFVEPYNIEVLYKLPDTETNFNYTLVPAEYEKSIKLANLIKYLCLDAYNAVAPAGFLEKTFPKMLVFVGSFGYNSDGTILLGTAEGGLKVSLYGVNDLDETNPEQLNNYYFNTIHHEFAHVLHQNIPYTTDFNQIVGAGYISDEWSSTWGANESLEAGFISDYSSKSANEDFVELISHYVLASEADWEATITNAGSVGGPIINEKMAIVKAYIKSSWNIDLDELRAEIQNRYANLSSQDLDNIN